MAPIEHFPAEQFGDIVFRPEVKRYYNGLEMQEALNQAFEKRGVRDIRVSTDGRGSYLIGVVGESLQAYVVALIFSNESANNVLRDGRNPHTLIAPKDFIEDVKENLAQLAQTP